jgi:hypothetical protein
MNEAVEEYFRRHPEQEEEFVGNEEPGETTVHITTSFKMHLLT